MPELTIRQMRPEDIDEVLIVENQAFSTPWSRSAFVEEVCNNDIAHYLVVIVDNKIIGYGGMWIIVDEAHVTNIAVLPKFHGRGIGALLLEHMITTAKALRATSMTLEVRPSNTPARKMYTRRGFKEHGLRPNYYKDLGEDAIIMWLKDL